MSANGDKRIRVLIAEDSAVQRAFLTYLLEETGIFEIAGTARDGAEAVEKTRSLRPDIVLMDCHMPVMSGIEATREIMATAPVPIVIASASTRPDDVEASLEALRHGALSFLCKPTGLDDPDHETRVAELVRTLRLMSEVKVVGRRAVRRVPAIARFRAPAKPAAIVGIGGSTGAPGILASILRAIAPDLAVPVLVVQHMTAGFVDGFARWLSGAAELDVTVARHGVLCEPRKVYIAPDGIQMGVDRYGRLRLADEPAMDGFRPSATYLFHSLAQSYGAGAMGIVLSGMGRDGAAGLLALREAGGQTAVQDAASCVVFGMPREALALGAADLALAVADLSQLIRQTARTRENVSHVRAD